ncbi:MAG: G1 family glutamic endopeptidase, partial [Gaiellaceae bacterium]
MKRPFSILVAALAVLGVAAAPATAARTNSTRDSAVSSNWAGYAVTAPGTLFTDVKGSWVQPSATCATRKATYSSFWIGLGGSNEGSQGLEQAGTSSDCQTNGRAVNYAWYEIIPAPPVIVPLTVSPGDTITGDVSVTGSTASFTLTNTTTGQTWSGQDTVNSIDLSSAEWIAEAPAQCGSFTSGRCTVLPLADFGSVPFSSAATTVTTQTTGTYTGTISDPTWSFTSITLGGGPNSSAATPSDLSADGTSFTVSWAGTGGLADNGKTTVKPKVKAKPKPK